MIFDQQGVFVRDFDLAENPGQWPKWWHDNGITVAWLQAHSQATQVPEANLSKWALACDAAGLDVGLWGSNGPDPAGDAGRIYSARQKLVGAGVPVRGIVAEVERYVNPTGDDKLSAQYVAALRDYTPLRWTPLGVCVQADCAASFDSQRGLDFAAWYLPGATAGKDGRAYFLPECYWNQSQSYDPVACYALQVKQGWPAGRIKPVLGTWGDQGNGDKRAFDYMEGIAGQYSPKGLSWYAGVTLQEFDLRVIKTMTNLGWASV